MPRSPCGRPPPRPAAVRLRRGRRRQVVTTTAEQPVEYRRVEERRDVAPPM
ncbi:hypothetical protein O7622_12855 [Micromonospora sp. WMMD1076]|uniref:hypothetical protein n=1 Tax=Micromonospora sp. WMMD1076 TaxID=3016103 RepID=UPI00249B6725|nr:hypothetical protein [Micromonospora sp. WMMD1076]WFF09376.1 hypothetical protein O7622_12855 [Micromonospora sp. WMMD1076]